MHLFLYIIVRMYSYKSESSFYICTITSITKATKSSSKVTFFKKKVSKLVQIRVSNKCYKKKNKNLNIKSLKEIILFTDIINRIEARSTPHPMHSNTKPSKLKEQKKFIITVK